LVFSVFADSCDLRSAGVPFSTHEVASTTDSDAEIPHDIFPDPRGFGRRFGSELEVDDGLAVGNLAFADFHPVLVFQKDDGAPTGREHDGLIKIRNSKQT
jgi:hypothetical protein